MDPEVSAAEKEVDDRRKQWLIDKMAGNSVIHAADKSAEVEAASPAVEKALDNKGQEQKSKEPRESIPREPELAPEVEKVVGTDIHVSGLSVEVLCLDAVPIAYPLC